MSPADHSMAQGADYIIHTPHSVRRFIRVMTRKNRGYVPSRAMRLAIHLFAHIQVGVMDAVLPDGRRLRFQGKIPGPHGVLIIHNDRMVRRFMTGGQLGFCESYLDGDWSSPDMAKFFEMILKNTDVLQAGLMGQPWMQAVSRLLHMMRPNTRKGSRKNIYAHYDIGNDFYSRWLDPSMTYSSALFEDGINDLEQAQLRKYEEMVRRLELQPQHHVLEIGCGWGGFAEYAARNVGCRVTGITISKAQYDYAVDRIQKAGLSDRVKIELIDYRDITGTYDRIASIEMFEAVGEAWWPTFFKTLRDRLTQGGWAVMQIITIRDDRFEHYRRNPDYIQRYIFPGGMLPSKAVLKQQIEKAGLRTGESLSFGADYAKTLKLWNDRFQAAWPHLRVNGLDERFKRLWEQYLCYCQAGFATGNIDVIQIAAHKDAHRHGSIHFETTRR